MAKKELRTWVPPSEVRKQILFYIQMISLMSAGEVAEVTLLPESTVRDELEAMEKAGLVLGVEMGAGERLTKRYASATRGLEELSRSAGLPLSAGWQSTEVGLATQAKRLPMVEAFYGLAIGLGKSPLVAPLCEEYDSGYQGPVSAGGIR